MKHKETKVGVWDRPNNDEKTSEGHRESETKGL